MSVESVLYTRLTTHNGLSALISLRAYPYHYSHTPTLPFITYSRVSTVRESAMGVDSNVVKARFQLDVWAETDASMRAVKDQLRSALQRWSNITGTVVQDTFMLSENEDYSQDTEIYRASVDYEINYEE